jgi:putative membrane protein
MNDQRLTLLAMALSSTLSAGVAFSQTPVAPQADMATGKAAVASSRLSAQDRKFVDAAAEAGAAEVAMGQLAESHSGSADVKGLAARMVSDHQKAGDELKSIAQAKGASPPP